MDANRRQQLWTAMGACWKYAYWFPLPSTSCVVCQKYINKFHWSMCYWNLYRTSVCHHHTRQRLQPAVWQWHRAEHWSDTDRHSPNSAANHLDCIIYVSSLSCPVYSTVRVVKSLVRTDHCAAAHTDSSQIPQTAVQKTYQPLSPFQHASYLHYISNLDFPSRDAQQGFDVLYELATSLLIFYPVRTITVSSRDPNFVTPFIKAKLCHKNRLVRKGKIEMANALAVQVSNDITRQNKKLHSSLNSKSGPKSL